MTLSVPELLLRGLDGDTVRRHTLDRLHFPSLWLVIDF